MARAARRELAIVLGLATSGIALAVLVAFAPWYQPAISGGTGTPVVVQTYPPDAPGVGAGVGVGVGVKAGAVAEVEAKATAGAGAGAGAGAEAEAGAEASGAD